MTKTPIVDSVLAIDIGNTRVGLAVSDASGLHDTRQVDLDKPQSWKAALLETWQAADPGKQRVVAVAGVVPAATRSVCELVSEVCGAQPLLIGDDIPLPMPVDLDNPDEVGVDRICSAAAAHDRIQAACAVASFGSAITVDCVSADGRFLGGAILPGLDLALRALHDHTAALPRVRPGKPVGPYGRNTHDAIVNGVVFGAVGALREIVERFATELQAWPQLVITGGHADLIAGQTNFIDAVVPDLCLLGVALAYRRAAEQS